MGREGVGTVWDIVDAVTTLSKGDYVVVLDSVAAALLNTAADRRRPVKELT